MLGAFFMHCHLGLAAFLVLAALTKGMNQAETTLQQYDYTLPRLVGHGNDLGKDWFFIHYIWHRQKEKTVRKRVAGVTIPPGLEAIIREYRLREHPKSYFVFSPKGLPGEKPICEKCFYRRHKKMLTILGFTEEQHTLYSYKHTGAINLYRATKDILAVQRHCRHSISAQTDAYLRKYRVIVNTKVGSMPVFGM
jgi:integrase